LTENSFFDLTPSAYAFGGETIARLPDGRAVFIPFAIPGEYLRVELIESKPGFTRARLLEVLEPSPVRIAPPCPHFGECGGCQYQHLPYPAQLAAKTEILLSQLNRIGKLEDPRIDSIYPSPQEFEYRNHIEFHLDPDGAIGFHKPRSNSVLPIQTCLLPEAALGSIWPQLSFEPGLGIQNIGLRLGKDDDIQIILGSDNPSPPELVVDGLPVSIVYLSPHSPLVMAGSPSLEIEVLTRSFRVSAASFFQANTQIAGTMVQHLLAALEARGALRPEATVLELYSGVGLFSAFLAGHVGRLVAVEASPSAVDDFVYNLDEFDNVEVYEAPAAQALPSLDLQPEFVLLDPPRSGLEPPVLDALVQMSPQLIAYVSCDPATLARDLRRLSLAGYRLSDLAVFDQFPQTSHIESITLMSRE
jgi:23S rRNA (uracil1939-C5)-methyltransferase